MHTSMYARSSGYRQVIEKPDATRDLILKAIEASVLFKSCGAGDLAQLVEAFAPVSFAEGTQVITQVRRVGTAGEGMRRVHLVNLGQVMIG